VRCLFGFGAAWCGLAPHPPLLHVYKNRALPLCPLHTTYTLSYFVTPTSRHAHARSPTAVLAARPHRPLRRERRPSCLISLDLPRLPLITSWLSRPQRAPSHPLYRSDSSNLSIRPSSTCGPTASPMAAVLLLQQREVPAPLTSVALLHPASPTDPHRSLSIFPPLQAPGADVSTTIRCLAVLTPRCSAARSAMQGLSGTPDGQKLAGDWGVWDAANQEMSHR